MFHVKREKKCINFLNIQNVHVSRETIQQIVSSFKNWKTSLNQPTRNYQQKAWLADVSHETHVYLNKHWCEKPTGADPWTGQPFS